MQFHIIIYLPRKVKYASITPTYTPIHCLRRRRRSSLYSCYNVCNCFNTGEKEPERERRRRRRKDQGLLPGRRREETRRIPGEKKPERRRKG